MRRQSKSSLFLAAFAFAGTFALAAGAQAGTCPADQMRPDALT